MTADEFRAILESELKWRQEDMAFFKNQLNNLSDEVEKERYRKSLVLILYAHLEGCVKIALQTYIQYINEQNLKRNEVEIGLMVAGMHKEFLAYENIDRKCKIFHRSLPEDKELHRHFRRVDFMNQIEDIKEQPLIIDDTIIDTESNLWYVLLQKNLYKIGLPIDLFDMYRIEIDALVNRRNSIAHGNSKSGVDANEYQQWEGRVYNILADITRILYDYALHKRYLANK